VFQGTHPELLLNLLVVTSQAKFTGGLANFQQRVTALRTWHREGIVYIMAGAALHSTV